MKVAIITVNYNGRDNTLELLESLKLLKTENCELKTAIVDNASSDGSVKAVHKQFPDVDILQTGKNLGFAGGFNKGLEYGKIWDADYYLIINNDCLIKDSDLLDKLINVIKSDQTIGFVSPKIYFAPDYEFHKDRYADSDKGKVIWYAGGQFDWDNIGSVHRGMDEVDKGKYDQIAQTGIFSGACVLIKKEVLEKVGMFDEKYFLYFEDSELVKRATDAGFKIFYNGQTSVYHKVSQSTGVGSNLTDYYHTRNRLIFGMEYGKFRTKFALLREALKLLFFGRNAQRKGVWDYLLGARGNGLQGLNLQVDKEELEYPLTLSIGIVNYNTADLTRKLLDSIFQKDSGFNPETMEVIVLDNGDTDPSYPIIKEYLGKIKYLRNEENEGFSKGYNKTIKYSKGEYYLMLNSDIEVLKDSLTELIKSADHYKEAVLGGKLIFPDGSNQDSVFHLPTLTGAFSQYFLSKPGAYFMFEPKGINPTKVEGLVMACMLIPKKILNNVGLLDEGTFIFFEDIEYCRRLKRFGLPLYFIPSAKFIHHHGASTKRIGTDVAYQHLNKAAQHYHGKFYYSLLSLILRIGQKWGRVKTPISRWTIQ